MRSVIESSLALAQVVGVASQAVLLAVTLSNTYLRPLFSVMRYVPSGRRSKVTNTPEGLTWLPLFQLPLV